MIDYSQPTTQEEQPYFNIKLKFEHGDADSNTFEHIHVDKSKENELNLILDFLFKVRNFRPFEGFANMGYYQSLRDAEDITAMAAETWPDKKYPGDIASEYIIQDLHYSNTRACLDDIELYIEGRKMLLMDMDARKTNALKLPEIGSDFQTNMGHIGGSSVFEKSMSYHTMIEEGIPMYEDEDDKIYTTVYGKVQAYQISERYSNYDVYDVLIKMDDEKDIYFTHQLKGHVEKTTKE